MKVKQDFYSSSDEIHNSSWDIGFIGTTLDDRGKASVDFLRSKCNHVIEIIYMPETFSFKIGSSSFPIDIVGEWIHQSINDKKRILIDSTTLGFVEILVLLRELLKEEASPEVLYLQPISYNRKEYSRIINKRAFEISTEVIGYKAIPGFSKILTESSPHNVVFLLGYEAERMDRAIEDYEMINPSNCIVVFAVPGFKAGWELDSYANNVPVIKNRKISGGIRYAGSTNPLSTYKLLEEIQKSIDVESALFIAPIGTKPMAIGAAIFACEHPDVNILYDHPIAKTGRTNDIAKWYIYKISKN